MASGDLGPSRQTHVGLTAALGTVCRSAREIDPATGGGSASVLVKPLFFMKWQTKQQTWGRKWARW